MGCAVGLCRGGCAVGLCLGVMLWGCAVGCAVGCCVVAKPWSRAMGCAVLSMLWGHAVPEQIVGPMAVFGLSPHLAT